MRTVRLAEREPAGSWTHRRHRPLQTAAAVLKLLYVILYSSSLASIALLVIAFGLQARSAFASQAQGPLA